MRDTARTVAALSSKTAILIEDAVGRDGAGRDRRLDAQQLIESDAEVAVTHAPDALGLRQPGTITAIDDHKIIAGTVHFGKTQGIHCAAPASAVSAPGLISGPLLPQALSNRLPQSSRMMDFKGCRFMGKV
jgi:hypothetical protein